MFSATLRMHLQTHAPYMLQVLECCGRSATPVQSHSKLLTIAQNRSYRSSLPVGACYQDISNRRDRLAR